MCWWLALRCDPECLQPANTLQLVNIIMPLIEWHYFYHLKVLFQKLNRQWILIGNAVAGFDYRDNSTNNI